MPDYAERAEWEARTKNAIRKSWITMREDADRAIAIGLLLNQDEIADSMASALMAGTYDSWWTAHRTVLSEFTDPASVFQNVATQKHINHVAVIAMMLAATIWDDVHAATIDWRARLSSGDEPGEPGGVTATTGPTPRQMAMDIFSDARLDTIAITETTRAIAAAETAAADELLAMGIAISAVWVTERDEKVCPVCRPLHGRTLDSPIHPFPYGPPAHPRCRCYLTWKPSDGQNQNPTN